MRDDGEAEAIQQKQLRLLILFLIGGADALPAKLRSNDLPSRQPIRQQQLAEALGVSQPTISGWKSGKQLISPSGELQIARYCGRPLEQLQSYLAGQITLSQFWSGAMSQTSAFQQVLALIPQLHPQERAEVVVRCLNDWIQESQLRSGVSTNEQPISLSWLILKEALKPRRAWSQSLVPLLVISRLAGTSLEQLISIFAGRVSSIEVLTGLSQVLTKDLTGESFWSVEELQEIASWVDSIQPESEAEALESEWHSVSDTETTTIARLVDLELKNRSQERERLSDETGIPTERLIELQNGAYPSSSEICDLAQGLRKQPGIFWSEEELLHLRTLEFGDRTNGESRSHENDGTNGNGERARR